jgi:DNA-binding CsgD family transcriptional regulator
VADEHHETSSQLIERLDRIADLMALTLVRGMEQEEQIRILSAAGYAPAQIGAFLGIRPNTVSVTLSRARKSTTKRSAKSRGRADSGD